MPVSRSGFQALVNAVWGAASKVVHSVSGAVGSVTGNVGGNVVGSVGSVVGAVGSVTGNVGGNVNGSVNTIGATGLSAIWGHGTRSLTDKSGFALTAGSYDVTEFCQRGDITIGSGSTSATPVGIST